MRLICRKMRTSSCCFCPACLRAAAKLSRRASLRPKNDFKNGSRKVSTLIAATAKRKENVKTQRRPKLFTTKLSTTKFRKFLGRRCFHCKTQKVWGKHRPTTSGTSDSKRGMWCSCCGLFRSYQSNRIVDKVSPDALKESLGQELSPGASHIMSWACLTPRPLWPQVPRVSRKTP